MVEKIRNFFKAICLILKYGSDIVFDSLTKLLGREIFQKMIRKEITRAKRYNSTLSLVFVDIDNLKKVNDIKGHIEGDKVIIVTARFLESCCRESDYVFRYGGDEFIILLTNTDSVGRTSFEELLKGRLKENSNLLFSFGGSTWNGENSEEFIEKADAEMYQQKKQKREKKN